MPELKTDEYDALNDSLSSQLAEHRADKLTEAAPEKPEEEEKPETEVEGEAEETEQSEQPEETEGDETEEKPDEAASQPAGQVVKLTVGGREVEVSSETAEAIRREMDARAGRYGSELQQLREQIARLEGVTSAQVKKVEKDEDIEPPDPELLNPASEKFDPASYHEQMLAYQEALVVGVTQRLEERRTKATETTQQQQADAQKWTAYVAAFYESAPELADKRDIVTAVYRANFETLKALPSDADVYRELRRLTHARIEKLAPAAKPAAPKAPTLSSSRPATVSASRKAEDKDETMTDAIVARRRAMGL